MRQISFFSLVSFSLGVALVLVFLILQKDKLIRSEKIIQPCPEKNQTLVPQKKPPTFLTLEELPTEWEIFNVVNSKLRDEEQVDIFYFPPKQNLKVPSLMSDYSFILIRNNVLEEHSFSESYYGILDSFASGELIGTLYNDGRGGVWLQAHFAKAPPQDPYERARVIVHAESREAVKKLVESAGKIVVREFYTSSTFNETPRREIFSPNTTDSSGKYRYYLPSGYIKQPKEPGWNWSTWRDASGKIICITLIGLDSEPCQFSTSGCTCCNTGCELLDLVLYTTSAGYFKVSELLQKGTDQSMGPRFIYDATDHPWIYYSASFGAAKNEDAKGVLDLLYMVESIERTY